ncbi:mitochondrial ribonuclease P catalytic subunit isoform X2 [Arctopsyche grandis]
MKLYNSIPAASAYSAVISASLRNDEPEIGWNILRELVNVDKIPTAYDYESFISYYVKKFEGKSNELLSAVEKLLEFAAERSLLLNETSMEIFLNVFTTELRWKAKSVMIKKSGQCPNCEMFLNKSVVSVDEHKLLKEAFYKQVMIGKNVFIKSNPKEVEDFLDFVKKTEPYDMVVDGLNVAYSVVNVKSPQILSNVLVSVVKNILESNREKVLVLGRKHMVTWPRKHMEFLGKHCFLYLVDDSSYDDTFLLYAALSATHTDFMSRDLMRSHKFLLENEKHIFKRWQEIHQHSLIYLDAGGKAHTKTPFKWVQYAQKNTNWHISYLKNDETLKLLDFPKHWICLKP